MRNKPDHAPLFHRTKPKNTNTFLLVAVVAMDRFVIISSGGGFHRYFFELVAPIVMGVSDGAFCSGDDFGQLGSAPVLDARDAFVLVFGQAAVAIDVKRVWGFEKV